VNEGVGVRVMDKGVGVVGRVIIGRVIEGGVGRKGHGGRGGYNWEGGRGGCYLEVVREWEGECNWE
jgi:hypothetical protein